jgi:VCBS repeat-containing protein
LNFAGKSGSTASGLFSASHIGAVELPHHGHADAITVSDPYLLFSGDYKRSGPDLILSKDGREHVVENYFTGEKRAALAAPDGAQLSGDIVSALTGHVQYAQASGAANAGKVIGHVTKLAGNATVIRNGVSIVLNMGDNVHKGDVVQSGSNSSLGITFIDGTVFGLASNARMVLNEMVYDPNGSSNSSFLTLVQGTITFVAGQTAKHGDMKVDTPVATMGIRGTACLVEVGFDVPVADPANSFAIKSIPVKFQVLQEADGSIGSYLLYAKTDLTFSNPIATINRIGEVTAFNANGQISVSQVTQIAPEVKAIIDQTLKLYYPNYNPTPNPSTTAPGSTPANPVAPAEQPDKSPIKFELDKPNIIQVPINVPNPDKPGETVQKLVEVNLTPHNTAPTVVVTPVVDKTTFQIGDQVIITDPDDPRVNPASPFNDVPHPYVAGTAKVLSATGPAYTPAGLDLTTLVNVNPETGAVTYNPASFAFLKPGDKVVITIGFNANSGPDTVAESLTITINGVNDAPVIDKAIIAVSEGGTVVLSQANVGITDVDSTSFTFIVSNVTHGTFQTTADGVTWIDATSFTSAGLNAGHVRFVHDGGEATPTFSILADDGGVVNNLSDVLAGTVDFTNVNDTPVVINAALTVSEGGTVVLDAAAIGVTDPDSASFTFAVSNVTHGRFQTTTDGSVWSDATTFTTADLSAGHVRLVHDGSHAAPTFSIQANDGEATHNLSNVLAGTVDFTIVDSVPVIDHASLTISQGGTVTLTTADIDFTDSDDAGVTYTVSNLSHGHFEIIDGNVAQAVTSFTSDDVAAGRVAFVHDGSSGVPTFSLTPNDGLTNGTTVAGAVTFSAANYTLTSTEGVIINVSTEGATSGFVFPGAGNVTTPGVPEDRIAIGYDVGGSHVVRDNAPLLGVNQMAPVSSETDSSGGTTFVSTTLDAGHGVTLVQTLALGSDANFFTTTIDITNGGTSDISNLRFLRNFDPDQDVQAHNDYRTFNDVVQNPNGAETFAIVSATGVESGTKVAMVGLGAEWRASVFGFTNTDPYASHAFDSPTDPNGALADLSLSLTSSLGTLTPGSHVQVTYITTNNVATTGSNALYGTTGANTIDGLGGDDLLIGLGGADTFKFASGYGHNTIKDFSHSDGDKIDLTGVTGVHGINDLQITPSGADTIIDLGNGDSLTLANVSAASLVAGDFVFAVNHAPAFTTGSTVTQLSVPANGVPFSRGEVFAFGPTLSSDGRFTVFGASNEIPGPNDDNARLGDVYLYDRLAGTYKWVSDPADFISSGITPHSGEIYDGLGTISRDGQTVAFKGEYQTTQIIGGQPFTSPQSEIFLYNTSTGLITLVPGLTGDEPSISGSGNQIVSTGQALTIPPGNIIAYNDVLVTDRAGHVLTRISGDANASPVNTADISADGRYVTFWTTASQLEVKNIKPTGGPLDNLTFDVATTYPADPSAPSGPVAQVYVFDRQTETINLVSVSPAGHMGNGNSSVRSIQTTNGSLDLGDDWKSAISVDDRFITFQSNASNLVAGDSNGATDVFLYDLQTHQVQLVSVAADGSAANGSSYRPAISPDGNHVAFASDATNLLGASATPAGADGFQTYVRDLDPATGLVSTGFAGFHNGDNQYGDSVNRGGGLVAFGGAALAFTANQGKAELISAGSGTVRFSGGSISDYNPAADTLTVTVTVTHGTLTPVVPLNPGSGLTIVGGFNGTQGKLEFTGSIDAINQALQSGVTYTPAAGGADAITMTVADGRGGTATQTTQFDPHAPQITGSFSTHGVDFIAFDPDQPQALLLAQGQVKFFGELISDSNPVFNPNADDLTVTVSVGHGTLTPVSLGNHLSIVGGLDGSHGVLEFTGSTGDVNQVMQSGAIYTATSGGPDAITIVVTDGHGGTAVQSTQFNPQAPAIDGGPVSGQYNVFLVDQSGGTQGVVVEDSSFSTPNSGTLFTKGGFGFTDADLTDTHTATVIGSPVVDASHAAGFVVPNGGLGTFTPLAVTESAGSGEVPWTFTVDNALVQGLGRGQYITETYAVQLDDHNGSHPTQNVAMIIAGFNDAPVIATDNLAVSQNGSTTTISGLSVSDRDTSDSQFTVTATAGAGVASPATDSGNLTDINSDLTNNGIVYSPGGPAPLTDKVSVTVSDSSGSIDTVNFIFNVAGLGPNVTLQGTPGKDVIFATGYQDTLTGGAAADQFVFTSNTGGHDTITDFTSGQDKIRLNYHAFDAAGPNDFSSWLATHATDSNNDVLIDLNVDGLHPGVDTILLKNVASANLHAGDFHTV